MIVLLHIGPIQQDAERGIFRFVEFPVYFRRVGGGCDLADQRGDLDASGFQEFQKRRIVVAFRPLAGTRLELRAGHGVRPDQLHAAPVDIFVEVDVPVGYAGAPQQRNAPVFGDVEQLAGRNYTASFLQADPEKIAVDLSKAYPDSAGVRSFRRTVDIGEEKITVSDDFSLETPLPATVTLLTPSPVQVIDRNHLKIGSTTLETRNISFDSMEKMPLLEGTQLGFPDGIWRCNLTALRFKSESAKYEFIFKADHPAAP